MVTNNYVTKSHLEDLRIFFSIYLHSTIAPRQRDDGMKQIQEKYDLIHDLTAHNLPRLAGYN